MHSSLNQYENKTDVAFHLVFILLGIKYTVRQPQKLEKDSKTMLHVFIWGQNCGCRWPGFKGCLGILKHT